AVRTGGKETSRTSVDLCPWRPDSPDDARFSLHVLLPQCVCHESILGEPGIRRTFCQLPSRNHVWPRFPGSGERGVERIFGIQRRCRRREILAELADCRCKEDRAVGRIVWWPAHGDGIGALLGYFWGGWWHAGRSWVVFSATPIAKVMSGIR